MIITCTNRWVPRPQLATDFPIPLEQGPSLPNGQSHPLELLRDDSPQPWACPPTKFGSKVNSSHPSFLSTNLSLLRLTLLSLSQTHTYAHTSTTEKAVMTCAILAHPANCVSPSGLTLPWLEKKGVLKSTNTLFLATKQTRVSSA